MRAHCCIGLIYRDVVWQYIGVEWCVVIPCVSGGERHTGDFLTGTYGYIISPTNAVDLFYSVGDYNSRWVGVVCLSVSVSPFFFTFHDEITSKRFELLS